MERSDDFGFPYFPYSIQRELMTALYAALEERKVAIFESPTGTGKSLSAICATLSWLNDKTKAENEEIENQLCEYAKKIELADADDDWMNAYGKKLEYKNLLDKVENKKQHQIKIGQRLREAEQRARLAVQNSSSFYERGTKRLTKIDDNIENEFQEKIVDPDEDLIPEDYNDNLHSTLDNDKFDYDENKEEQKAREKAQPLRCMKIIYASRTHSQLEQFAEEIKKTKFRPRVLTVGSRQMLCVNETVRTLRPASLINDRCNELLNANSKSKRLKADGNKSVKKTGQCGCEYTRPEAIEDLANQILARSFANVLSFHTQKSTVDWLMNAGKKGFSCPYFASRNALPLCEIVLVPYNILLHKSTREAWNLDLKDNIVIIDEAHNLLQTLASIHSSELNQNNLQSCCTLIADYMDRFGTRLSPSNLRYVRHLHIFAGRLLTIMCLFLTSIKDRGDTEAVFSIPRFIALLDCTDIDFFKLLSYLETSNICRKLRDYSNRYMPRVGIHSIGHLPSYIRTDTATKLTEPNEKPSLGFAAFLQKRKSTDEDNVNVAWIDANKTEPSARAISATPLYQLKEFLEALTIKSEDGRILIQKGNSDTDPNKFRFLLLNPAEKLKDVVEEARSVVLLGGTMKPIDQLLDAFQRVCGVSQDRISEFTCDHVIDDSQLIALSLARGPSKIELNLSFSQRTPEIMTEIARSLINFMRHVPNGAVVFFPSYAFLGEFLKTIHLNGFYQQLNAVKRIIVEKRGSFVVDSENGATASDNVWSSFCTQARTSMGALLLSVIGGSLSEGINFSDELGRCIVVVGLPYANKNSLELVERMKYADEKCGKGTGARLYESMCVHAVNQAIGRAIRHRNDYAAILLLDARYGRTDIGAQLPYWIRRRAVHCEMFNEAMSKLVKFFRNIV